MIKWEYKTLRGNVTESVLNQLGQLGWELCVHLPHRRAWVFKRMLP